MTDYFIDYTTGSDSDSGTSEHYPWKTFANLASRTVTAGDRILLKCGTTWPGGSVADCVLQLTGVNPGSKTVPFIIRGYGLGPKPCIDGEDTATLPLFLNESSAGDMGAFWIDGIEVKRTTNTSLGIGIAANFTTLHPAYLVTNCYVHHHGLDGILLGSLSSGASNSRVRVISGCVVDTVGNDCFSFGGTCDYVFVQDCIASNAAQLDQGSTYGAVGETSGDGYTAHGTSSGHRFYRCTAYNCVDGLNVVNYGTELNIIERCHFYACLEKNIWIINDPAASAGAGPSVTTNWDLRNNIVAMTATQARSARGISGYNASVTAAGVMIGSPDGEFGIAATEMRHIVTFYNNLLYNPHATAAAFYMRAASAGANLSSLASKNNVFAKAAGAGGAGVHARLAGSAKFSALAHDNNLYHNDVSGYWEVDAAAKDFAGWKLVAGIGDASAAVGDPLLVGAVTSNVDQARIGAGSPAIGLGANLAGTFADDWEGRIRPAAGDWDAGAFHRWVGSATPIVKGGRLLSGVGL